MNFDELNKTDLGYNGFTDFEAGAQSRQAEIDALQKVIDEALKILQEMKHNGAYRATYILKGKDND